MADWPARPVVKHTDQSHLLFVSVTDKQSLGIIPHMNVMPVLLLRQTLKIMLVPSDTEIQQCVALWRFKRN